jgi:phosphoinositide-3-kinase, regulatory subunit 4
MVRSMISLSPDDRLSCEAYLVDYRDTVFPESFYTFFNRFISDINDLPALTYPSIPNTALLPAAGVPSSTAFGSEGVASALASSADDRIERIWLDFDSVIAVLPAATPEQTTLQHKPQAVQSRVRAMPHVAGPVAIYSLECYLHRRYSPCSSASLDMKFAFQMSRRLRLDPWVCHSHAESFQSGKTHLISFADGPALIVLSLLCANIRNCVRPTSVLRALDLFLALTQFLSDEIKLDRLLPYVVALFQDEVASVRAAALRTMTQIVSFISCSIFIFTIGPTS